MTEQGEKWVAELMERDEPLLTYTREYADYLIRAFCAEVERSALGKCEKDRTVPCMACKSYAFDELKRELLGGDDAGEEK